MSAPPLHHPPIMPTMVSRLPKFGSRTKSVTPSNDATQMRQATFTTASSTRLTNGFYHHPGPVEGDGSSASTHSSVKQNGFIRVPTSLSMKWRKDEEAVENRGAVGARELRRGKVGNIGQNRSGLNAHLHYSHQTQGSTAVTQRDAKRLTSAGKGCGSHLTSLLSPQSSHGKLVSKNGLHETKSGLNSLGIMSGTKLALNDVSGSKLRGRATALPRPSQRFVGSTGSRPGSGHSSSSGSPLQNKPQATRSQSSNSLDSAISAVTTQLTESDRFRSRSLTQVRRQPSPTFTHPPRSYSTNRAMGRGLKVPVVSSALTPSIGCLGKFTSEGGGKVEGTALRGRTGVPPSLLLPSVYKKPLLPNLCPTSKPSGISYKLSRPSLSKQLCPLRVTPLSVPRSGQEGNRATAQQSSVETQSTAGNTPGIMSLLLFVIILS